MKTKTLKKIVIKELKFITGGASASVNPLYTPLTQAQYNPMFKESSSSGEMSGI